MTAADHYWRVRVYLLREFALQGSRSIEGNLFLSLSQIYTKEFTLARKDGTEEAMIN
jgi:hypothetical protein